MSTLARCGAACAALAALITTHRLASAQTVPANSVPQTVASPAPSAAPSPQTSATPSPIGPALGNNDPCTSLSAIVTRPTVSNSVCTVRPHHVLVETGYQITSSAGGTTVQYPQALIRIGTSIPAFEVDLQPPSYQRLSSSGPAQSGATDGAIGIKYVLGYTPKLDYGAQIFMTIPTGASGFTAGKPDEAYAFNAGYTLSPAFSLAGVADLQSNTNGSQRWTSFVPSLVLSATLPASVSLFGEIAQFTNATGPATGTRTQYIVGTSYDFTPRVQVDLETGFSPTVSTGKYHYVGAGFSYYF